MRFQLKNLMETEEEANQPHTTENIIKHTIDIIAWLFILTIIILFWLSGKYTTYTIHCPNDQTPDITSATDQILWGQHPINAPDDPRPIKCNTSMTTINKTLLDKFCILTEK